MTAQTYFLTRDQIRLILEKTGYTKEQLFKMTTAEIRAAFEKAVQESETFQQKDVKWFS